MKQVLEVKINNKKSKSYNIDITDENLLDLMQKVNIFTKGKKRIFVISEKVYKIYQDRLNLCEDEIFILKDGEKEKNYKNYLKILDFANKINLNRDDFFIAIGGGVVGDITGFVASTYKRGTRYIQIPTTLLSMIDSSVGGKTAINMGDVKNVIGSFWQPCAVFINLNFLKTLDERQYNSGLGEMIKYAFIEDDCGYSTPLYIFEYMLLSCEKILQRDFVSLSRLIEYCLNLKISVVQQDEKENGLRKILNFGHTIAHALESKTKYKKFTHGEAVITGITYMLNWAYMQNYITYSYYKLGIDLLTKYNFKSEVKLRKYLSPDEFLYFIKKDKKTTNENQITFIVPHEKKHVKELKISVPDILKMF